MARIRKIDRRPPDGRNFYLVDASFLANRFIPEKYVPKNQRVEVRECNDWWDEIDDQLDHDCARVYIPDICIAETFKTLAKKYYQQGWFPSAAVLGNARKKLRETIQSPSPNLRAARRKIRYHDISTTRDIIIAVDRFYELFHRHKKHVSVPDLIIVATAKYLLDFYDIPKTRLHLVTLDRALYEGTAKVQELPNAYNPTLGKDAPQKVFR